MIDESIPLGIIQGVLAPLGIVSATPVPPGMSGASVFRCQLNSGDLVALRRWPDGADRSRVEEVHSVITHARENGCTLVPSLITIASSMTVPNRATQNQTIFAEPNGLWEAQQWMPGEPAVSKNLENVRLGAALIAQFHTSIRGLGVSSRRPPAILARLSRLKELDDLVPQAIAMTQPVTQTLGPELAGAISEACHLVQWKWDEVRLRITRSLSQYADTDVETHYVLRDVHRDHILFTDNVPSGLIDFDAVRVDTRLADLARWVGSFLGDLDVSDGQAMDSLWNAAVAGFRCESPFKSGPLTEKDTRMAKDLCFATTWISLGNWLVWVLCQERSFPPGPEVVATRIRELIRSATWDIS